MKNHTHFYHKQTWENYDAAGSITNYKVPAVINNIPKDVNSILDVGCGNGIITNILSENYNIVGADMAAEALKQLKCKTIMCSSDDVPVEDNSFDMVFSSQLLEHLSDSVLVDTISEFKRIAKKYIFITVPNEEYLSKNETKCPECSNVFNVNGHFQSFSAETLDMLLGENTILLHQELTGNLHREYSPFLMKIRQRIGNRYFNPSSYTVCPECGNNSFPLVKGNIVSKFTNGMNRIVSKKKPYWLVLLFEKRFL